MSEPSVHVRDSAPARPVAARTPQLPAKARAKAPSPFKDILCAVDGSRGSAEALHQALALCGPGTKLRLVAVRNETGVGFAAQADLSEMHARTALEGSLAIAKDVGVDASVSLLRGAPTSDLLLAAAEGHDLLALGCHSGSRLRQIMLGGTAAQIAHRARCPVLVARRVADGNNFPQSILLASDGSPGSWAAARIATALSRSGRTELRLVHVPDGMHPELYREVLKQLTAIEKATGVPPGVDDDPGHVAERICQAAAARSSLIVIGHRGLAGARALGSVSERVVNRAPCSVLVAPVAPPAGAAA